MLKSEYRNSPTAAIPTPPESGPDPRPVNTGVYTPTPLNETGTFDWYAATVQEDPETLSAILAVRLDAERIAVPGKHGYTSGWDFLSRGSIVARMIYGGPNGNPNVWASGDDTQALVDALRDRWPDAHAVTRADVAIDFDAPGSWESIYQLCTAVVDERGLRQSQAGDWRSLVAGRTYYVGSRRSAVFARFYEKGLQLRGLQPPGVDLTPYSTDHVRLELQVRPDGDLRRFAARCEPVALFGSAEWARDLLERVTGLALPRVHIKARRLSDHERALHYLVRQYGAHLQVLADELGGWEHVGEQLQAIALRIEAHR